MRPGGSAPSVLFQGPHSEETRDSAAYASVSLSATILSPQVTSSEAIQMLASQQNVSRVVMCGRHNGY